MKKTLLSLFAAVACLSASADEVTFDFTASTYGQTCDNNTYVAANTVLTQEPATITVNTASKVRFWKANNATHLRINQGGEITVAIPDGTISKIGLVSSSSNNATMTVAGKVADNAKDTYSNGITYEFTLATPAASVVVAQPTGNKTAQITKLIVTYSTSGPTKNGAELKFAEEAYTVTLGEAFDAPKATTVSDGAVTYASSRESVATVDASTGAVTIVGLGSTVITAESAETDTYYAGKATYTLTVMGPQAAFELATEMVNGKYLLVNESGKVAKPIDQADSFGYLYVTDATIDGSYLKTSTTNAFTFTKEGDDWTIMDCYGRYLAMDATHASFQLYTTPQDNYLWSIELTDEGEATIKNVGRNTYTIAWVSKYSEFNVSETTTEGLPILYVEEGSAAISAVAAEKAEAPVEYYNLQGMKVANPQGGVFIKRQGDKAVKVML
ncbi:MAG: hypothetical protein NC187_09645 [Candidatus Amulumruptor caecigallinarius]|nr:hypothetical protein [Candidatus Amulumruptor caecigallinarius]MCM1397731.1 hypothetical protein [Candidatus Amulumruptor caecigallinarius]MCM1454619.1 hypothetical protein [bacterium]